MRFLWRLAAVAGFRRTAPKTKAIGRSKPSSQLRIDGAAGNRLVLDASLDHRNSQLTLRPDGENTVAIGRNVKLHGAKIHIKGRGNRLIIEDDVAYTGRILIKGNGQTVRIGRGTTTVDVYILCSEGCDVIIGAHCMFSRKIEIRTSDAHSLVDQRTGLRVNLPQSIHIGNHVWVGVGTIINKGTVIADDCTIGAQSFVNKAFSVESAVIAGAPAKIVKTGVTWNRGRKKRFGKAELEAWKSLSQVQEDAERKSAAPSAAWPVPVAVSLPQSG